MGPDGAHHAIGDRRGCQIRIRGDVGCHGQEVRLGDRVSRGLPFDDACDAIPCVHRAVAIGLVSEIVPHADLDGAVETLLAKLAGYERPSVVTCKAYLREARKADYNTANDLAGNMLAVVLSSRR